jgi:hypothetical protein
MVYARGRCALRPTVDTIGHVFSNRVQVAFEQIGVRVQRHRRDASIRCTTFAFAPELIARLAAVWRSECGVTRRNVGSACWQRATAVGSQAPTADGLACNRPSAALAASGPRPLPSAVRANASATNAGTATVRFRPLLSVPTMNSLSTRATLRCSSIRRRRKSMSHPPQPDRLTPTHAGDAEQQHQRAVAARLVGRHVQLRRGQVHVAGRRQLSLDTPIW